MRKIYNNKLNRRIAATLAMLIIAAAILAMNGTFAAPGDIVVTLQQPNSYTVIEKNASHTANLGGVKYMDVSDTSIAPASFVT